MNKGKDEIISTQVYHELHGLEFEGTNAADLNINGPQVSTVNLGTLQDSATYFEILNF